MIDAVRGKQLFKNITARPLPRLQGIDSVRSSITGKDKLEPALRTLFAREGLTPGEINLDQPAKLRLLSMAPALAQRVEAGESAETIFSSLELSPFVTEDQNLLILGQEENVKLIAALSSPAVSSPEAGVFEEIKIEIPVDKYTAVITETNPRFFAFNLNNVSMVSNPEAGIGLGGPQFFSGFLKCKVEPSKRGEKTEVNWRVELLYSLRDVNPYRTIPLDGEFSFQDTRRREVGSSYRNYRDSYSVWSPDGPVYYREEVIFRTEAVDFKPVTRAILERFPFLQQAWGLSDEFVRSLSEGPSTRIKFKAGKYEIEVVKPGQDEFECKIGKVARFRRNLGEKEATPLPAVTIDCRLVYKNGFPEWEIKAPIGLNGEPASALVDRYINNQVALALLLEDVFCFTETVDYVAITNAILNRYLDLWQAKKDQKEEAKEEDLVLRVSKKERAREIQEIESELLLAICRKEWEPAKKLADKLREDFSRGETKATLEKAGTILEKDFDPARITRECIELLGQLRCQWAVPVLLDILNESSTADQQSKWERMLDEIPEVLGDIQGKKCLPVLRKYFQDKKMPPRLFRMNCAEVIGALGARGEDFGVLIRVLKDESDDEYVRRDTVRGLVKLARTADTDSLLKIYRKLKKDDAAKEELRDLIERLAKGSTAEDEEE